MTERLLRQVQRRQEGASRVGIEGLQAMDLGQLSLREGRRGRGVVATLHRSSSPPIMFTEPNVGTRSATISPLIIRCSAATGGRHGGRHRTR